MHRPDLERNLGSLVVMVIEAISLPYPKKINPFIVFSTKKKRLVHFAVRGSTKQIDFRRITHMRLGSLSPILWYYGSSLYHTSESEDGTFITKYQSISFPSSICMPSQKVPYNFVIWFYCLKQLKFIRFVVLVWRCTLTADFVLLIYWLM